MWEKLWGLPEGAENELSFYLSLLSQHAGGTMISIKAPGDASGTHRSLCTETTLARPCA